MAVLSEEDMEKILGKNYRAQSDSDAKARGIQNEERVIRSTIDSLEGSKFPAWVTILVGIGLVVAGFLTTSGKEMWIQGACGVVIFIGGVWGLFYAHKRLAQLTVQGDKLHRDTAAANLA